ncbi:RIP metalloprotease RseP [Zymomonas mobilis]|uniref:RIP metalloprotease RseP n=1 Tax=Zymomonas mobilis TaxID=542 RepID=UPI0039EB8E8E
MNAYSGIMFSILSFIAVIGPLVFVHELGHYAVARFFGVKADVFSIGFGPEIFGWTDRLGTRWRIACLPFGGYVRFAGDMDPASSGRPSSEWLALSPEDRAKTFQAKKAWHRFLIVLAGPLTNIFVAILLFAAVFSVHGVARSPAVVSAIVPHSAADTAGLKVGDKITAVNSYKVNYFNDLQPVVQMHPDEEVLIKLVRDGRAMDVKVHLKAEHFQDRFGNSSRIGLLGILGGAPVIVRLPLTEIPQAATSAVGTMLHEQIDGIGQIITGRRSMDELGGPIRIARMSGQITELGFLPFVLFMAAISVNLGFINLLPVPMLDGGHLLFYAMEIIIRRPLTPVIQTWAFRFGLFLLLSLTLFATLNDLGVLVWLKQILG